jgi:hypothetical protein
MSGKGEVSVPENVASHTTETQADWKQTLFGYVNAVNEAGLQGDEALLRSVADAGHRNRLVFRIREAARKERELGIRTERSEVRARIERQHVSSGDALADVALHSVRTYRQHGLSWQEERVERERLRFVWDARMWRLDTAEPLGTERRQHPGLAQPDDEQEGLFERRDAMPSLPYLNLQPSSHKPRLYPGGGADGAYGYDPYRRGLPYRRDSAVAYAERWWNEPNPGYENFEVNCTNYVSQCLFAGQAPMNYTGRRESGWWYKGRANGRELWSFSWAVADSLQRYLSHPRGFGLRAEGMESPDRLELGDVICYDWDGSGTAFAPDGTPLVNANTVSSRHRYWDYRDSYAWTGRTRYRFFHLADEF